MCVTEAANTARITLSSDQNLDGTFFVTVKMTARTLILLAVVSLLHAGYSGYEHLSRLKALGQPQEALPKDIAFETLLGAILGIIGAALYGSPLKQISWASEMRQHKIDEMDARVGFASYTHRGKNIFSNVLKESIKQRT
ncbi:hypothetical protein NP233_g10768 [Leucocoprinus birnbaumii]|uniref:Membrane magnesium transporter n=1 Tax=Leucocoprinus birnbaumii TaxID=56174 RepID=A0AAD5YL06_9AGAR|nr:hypothetical protein NP233_g10768 [Leucocoprinus birnbaumii]